MRLCHLLFLKEAAAQQNNRLGALCVCICALLLLVCAGVEDVDTAMQAARKAFDEGPWPRMGGKVCELT